MCRLFGLVANQPVDLEFSLVLGDETFTQLGKQNPDGWGMGWYEGSGPRLHREPISMSVSNSVSPLVHRTISSVFICHVRYATQGEPEEKNCHPFSRGSWLFAHNGCVEREDLLEQLDKQHRAAIAGDTDSEVYFHWILQNIESEGNVPDGFRSAVKNLDGYTGLNCLLSDGKTLYAYRNAAKKGDYYSLFYLRRDPGGPAPETFRSKELSALINSKSLRDERAVLVCSEKLTEEDWQKIPLGCMLVADSSESRLVEV